MTKPESRRATRRRVLKDAKVVYLNNATIVSCRVRDLSDTGAKLICGDQLSVPSEFRFMLTGERVCRLAHVVWRQDDQVGIHFTGPPEPAPIFRNAVLSTV